MRQKVKMKNISFIALLLGFFVLGGCGEPIPLNKGDFIKYRRRSVGTKAYYVKNSDEYAYRIRYYPSYYRSYVDFGVNDKGIIAKITDIQSYNITSRCHRLPQPYWRDVYHSPWSAMDNPRHLPREPWHWDR